MHDKKFKDDGDFIVFTFQPLQNVKYRKEIYTRCDTRLRQECNNTLVEVPKEVCQERRHKECFQDFE